MLIRYMPLVQTPSLSNILNSDSSNSALAYMVNHIITAANHSITAQWITPIIALLSLGAQVLSQENDRNSKPLDYAMQLECLG